MNTNSTTELYKHHHQHNRAQGFSILKNERGALISKILGKNVSVLDLGCRDGSLTQFFSDGNVVTGADVDPLSLEKAKSVCRNVIEIDLNGDWHELGNNTYDSAVAGELLEHLFLPNKIIEQVADHLKPNGIFVGSVPNAFSLKNRIRLFFGKKKNTPLADPTHINHFSHSELSEKLHKQFKNVKIYPLGKYSRFDFLWPGMFSFDLFFTATKK